jgi:5-methylcytosine-specific restriction endonuclease McrA
MPTKVCAKCCEKKPVVEFYRRSSSKDGLQSYCKPCGDSTTRANLAANPERAKERRRAHYLANAEALRARAATYRDTERDTLRTRMRRRLDPTRHRVSNARRRARQAEGDLSLQDWREILEAHEHRCAYCGTDGMMTIEHMTPLSRGGSHTRGNVVPACLRCNLRKGTRTAEEFLALAA